MDLWVDIESNINWLPTAPYLLSENRAEETVERLTSLGFQVVEIDTPDSGSDIERALLIALSAQLGFSPVGAGNWSSFNDRLWDLLTADNHPPVAILIRRFDRVLREDVHVFVRCIHKLLSMTEGVGLAATEADLQVEYFFTGAWQF